MVYGAEPRETQGNVSAKQQVFIRDLMRGIVMIKLEYRETKRRRRKGRQVCYGARNLTLLV